MEETPIELQLNNFLNFKNFKFEFTSGLNVILGENGTGKTNLLKTVFALSRINSKQSDARQKAFLESLIRNTFQFRQKSSMIHAKSNDEIANIRMLFNDVTSEFTINPGEDWTEKVSEKTDRKDKICFIPSKDMLAVMPGLLNEIKSGNLPLDDTFFHLANALIRPENRSNIEPEILAIANELSTILDGKLEGSGSSQMEIINMKYGRVMEAQNISAGLRKFHVLERLLENGSVGPGSVLIWDMPEININNKLLRFLSDTLINLSKVGVCVFIATHSNYLIRYLDLCKQRKSEYKLKFFNLYYEDEDDDELSCETGGAFYELSNIAAINESVKLLDETA